jgi:SOS-response transcriptional repressor LexA
MQPDYREGDIIVFSPARTPVEGDDCFFRLMPDHHTTFKRLYFESEQAVRMQPLNPRFPPRTLPLEACSGIYPAIFRMQPVGSANR